MSGSATPAPPPAWSFSSAVRANTAKTELGWSSRNERKADGSPESRMAAHIDISCSSAAPGPASGPRDAGGSAAATAGSGALSPPRLSSTTPTIVLAYAGTCAPPVREATSRLARPSATSTPMPGVVSRSESATAKSPGAPSASSVSIPGAVADATAMFGPGSMRASPRAAVPRPGPRRSANGFAYDASTSRTPAAAFASAVVTLSSETVSNSTSRQLLISASTGTR